MTCLPATSHSRARGGRGGIVAASRISRSTFKHEENDDMGIGFLARRTLEFMLVSRCATDLLSEWMDGREFDPCVTK